MQIKPYFLFFSGACPWTIYHIENGRVCKESWLGGLKSIPLRNAILEKSNSWIPFKKSGTIKVIAESGVSLYLENLPNTEIAWEALNIAIQGKHPLTAFLISNSYLLGYTILQSTDTQDSLNECPLLFYFVNKKRCT